MRKLLLIVLSVISMELFAQAPQGLNYQAIAWDNNNLPKQNKTLTVTFNILDGSATGVIEFTESIEVTTNSQGLFTAMIGSTKPNEFKIINWSTGPKFLRVTIDGVVMGTTQILSVPYAMYADKAKFAESTPIVAGSGIRVEGNVIHNTGDPDADPNNEIQSLALNGNQVSLNKGGGNVNLPTQQLSLSGNQLSLSNGGGSIDLPGLITVYREDIKGASYTNGDHELNPQILVPLNGFYLVLISYNVVVFNVIGNGETKATIDFKGNKIHEFSTSSLVYSKEFNYFGQLGLLRQDDSKIKLNVIGNGSVVITNVKVYIQKIN